MTAKRGRESFRVAAVQASSVYLDRERTIGKACRLIGDAGQKRRRSGRLPGSVRAGIPDLRDYARPDVFELVVHREPKPLIRTVAGVKRRKRVRR